MIRRSLSAAVAVAVMAGSLLVATPATAAPRYSLHRADGTAKVLMTQPAPSAPKVIVEAHVVFERSNGRTLVSAIVDCGGEVFWSSQNLRAGQSQATADVRDLHVRGARSCLLRIYSATPGPAGSINPRNTFRVNLDKTWLRLRPAPSWAVAHDAPQRKVTSSVNMYGEPFRPPAGVSHVRYVADLEATNCYSPSGGCKVRHNRGGSTFTVQPLVIEHDAAGRHCRVHHGPVSRTTIDREVHHQKSYNTFTVRLHPSCSGPVRAGVRVVRVAGNPVMIEDGRWTSHYVTSL